jgi:hypothetical protein
MKGVEDAKEATTPDFKGAAKGSPVRGTERMSRQWTTRGSERGSVTDGDGRRRISEGRNRSRFRERTRVANMTEKRRGRRGRKERGMRGVGGESCRADQREAEAERRRRWRRSVEWGGEMLWSFGVGRSAAGKAGEAFRRAKLTLEQGTSEPRIRAAPLRDQT